MKGIKSVLKKIEESFRVMKHTIEVRPGITGQSEG